MPTTAIIAAMPMAMPSADRNTRSGLARRPAPPTRTTSAGLSRARAQPRAGPDPVLPHRLHDDLRHHATPASAAESWMT
jgi:hypothetical protein